MFGFIPLAHYMHGSMEEVGEAFLKNVTLWWGCAFALAVDVAQIGGLAMIAIGLCYVVLHRHPLVDIPAARYRIWGSPSPLYVASNPSRQVLGGYFVNGEL